MNSVAVRNLVIILGIAALGVVWQRGFGEFAAIARTVIGLAFLALIAVAIIRYFRGNPLTWYAIKPPQRVLFIACGVALVAIILAGPWILPPFVGPGGGLLLVVGLAIAMVWIVMESRRF